MASWGELNKNKNKNKWKKQIPTTKSKVHVFYSSFYAVQKREELGIHSTGD